MQNQEHEAMQCLQHCKIHHQELPRPPYKSLDARSHKSRATVNYTPIGVEPHGPTRGVWPIATVANDSQLYLVTSSI